MVDSPQRAPDKTRRKGQLGRLFGVGGLLRRWLRVGEQAVEYTRQAGLKAGVRRSVQVLGILLPVYGRAAKRLLWPRSDPYTDWQRRTEPGSDELAAQRQTQAGLAFRPLISILTPVYNPQPEVLRDTIASVLAQTYDHWELCLADGASTVPGVAESMTGAAARDARIRVTTLPENRGISGNLNAALEMSAGEFVLLLDHDDLLAPDLLYAIVSRLNNLPDSDVIYYDEDKISPDGRTRRDPWFKPRQWSPALMLSTNVLMHSAIRRQLVVDLGGFDPATDGAQDWDLALRLTERTSRLAHLPQIGYHWRQVPGSAAADANAKPWAYDGQKRAIEAYLARQGHAGARVSFPALGRVRVHWPVSGDLVSIVIPTKDKVELLRACLESIFLQTTYPNYEIVLVDTGSTEAATHAYYAGLEAAGRPVRIVNYEGDFNYSAANNLGAARATGTCLVFLNNDTEVLEPHWLDELVGWAELPGIGIVGAKLIRPNDTIQHAGLIIGLAGHGSHAFDGSHEGTYGPFGSSEWYRDVLAVTGACLALRREVFDQLGGFDDAYQIGFSDIELGLRAVSHGLRVIYTPFARLRHHEGASRGFHLPPADVMRAYWQMLPVVSQGDPYFSPNLSDAERRPSVAGRNELARAARLDNILGDFEIIYHPLPWVRSKWPEPGQAHYFPASTEGQASPPTAERILLVSHELTLTGAPLILTQAAKLLQSAGYEVDLVAPEDGPLRATLTESGVNVWIEPEVLHDARLIARHLPGVALVVANTILSWRAVVAARAARVACLWWVHESGFGETQAQRVAGLARTLSTAAVVVFASASVAQRYTPWVRPERSHVLHNGLAWEAAVAPESTSIGARAMGTCTLVNLASLEPRKGQAVLLDAVAKLSAALRSRVHVQLAGQALDRGYTKRVTRLAARLPGQVEILGPRPRAEALAYLNGADVFVLPSRDEVLPMTLLEAMALGKAIVATRVGGIMEAIEDGVEGLLVPPDDPAALAAALSRLLEDDGLRQRLGAAARARFEASFALEHFSDALLARVRALIAERRALSATGRTGAREQAGELPVAYRVADRSASTGPLLETMPVAVPAGPSLPPDGGRA